MNIPQCPHTLEIQVDQTHFVEGKVRPMKIKAKDDELKATDDQLKAKYKAIAKVKRAKAKRASKGKPFACVN